MTQKKQVLQGLQVLFLLFNCQTPAEGNEKVEMADAKDVDGTTITFWHSMGGVNGQAIDTLVKKFNDENEYGITVEAQYQGEYDDSLNKLKSAQIGNMGADLVPVSYTHLTLPTN